MKKHLFLSILVLLITTGINTAANATEFPVSVEVITDKQTYKAGETVYLHISINNLSDFTARVGGTSNDVIDIGFDLAPDVLGQTRNHFHKIIGTNHPSHNFTYAKSKASVAYGDLVLSTPVDPDGLPVPVLAGTYFVKATLPLEIEGVEYQVRARTMIQVKSIPDSASIEDVLEEVHVLQDQASGLDEDHSLMLRLLRRLTGFFQQIKE